jgi:hypothetical protein
VDHGQNFNNLILDYPLEALAFLAEAEARAVTPEVRITPIRHEQLKERLGERFRDVGQRRSSAPHIGPARRATPCTTG